MLRIEKQASDFIADRSASGFPRGNDVFFSKLQVIFQNLQLSGFARTLNAFKVTSMPSRRSFMLVYTREVVQVKKRRANR